MTERGKGWIIALTVSLLLWVIIWQGTKYVISTIVEAQVRINLEIINARAADFEKKSG